MDHKSSKSDYFLHRLQEYFVGTLCHRFVNASRDRRRNKTQITTAPVIEKNFRALVPQDSL